MDSTSKNNSNNINSNPKLKTSTKSLSKNTLNNNNNNTTNNSNNTNNTNTTTNNTNTTNTNNTNDWQSERMLLLQKIQLLENEVKTLSINTNTNTNTINLNTNNLNTNSLLNNFNSNSNNTTKNNSKKYLVKFVSENLNAGSSIHKYYHSNKKSDTMSKKSSDESSNNNMSSNNANTKDNVKDNANITTTNNKHRIANRKTKSYGAINSFNKLNSENMLYNSTVNNINNNSGNSSLVAGLTNSGLGSNSLKEPSYKKKNLFNSTFTNTFNNNFKINFSSNINNVHVNLNNNWNHGSKSKNNSNNYNSNANNSNSNSNNNNNNNIATANIIPQIQPQKKNSKKSNLNINTEDVVIDNNNTKNYTNTNNKVINSTTATVTNTTNTNNFNTTNTNTTNTNSINTNTKHHNTKILLSPKQITIKNNNNSLLESSSYFPNNNTNNNPNNNLFDNSNISNNTQETVINLNTNNTNNTNEENQMLNSNSHRQSESIITVNNLRDSINSFNIGINSNSPKFNPSCVIKYHLDSVRGLCISNDLRQLVSIGDDMLINYWDLSKIMRNSSQIAPVVSLRGHRSSIMNICSTSSVGNNNSSSSSSFYTSGLDGIISKWNFINVNYNNGDAIYRKYASYEDTYNELANNGSSSKNNNNTNNNMDNIKPNITNYNSNSFRAANEVIWSIKQKGDILVSASADGYVKVWKENNSSTSSNNMKNKYFNDTNNFSSECLSMLNTRTLTFKNKRANFNEIPTCVSFEEDTNTSNSSNSNSNTSYTPTSLLVSYISPHIKKFDIETGKIITDYSYTVNNEKPYNNQQINCMINNNTSTNIINNIIATGHEDHKIRLFDSRSGTLINTYVAHTDSISALSFGLNDFEILSACHDGSLRCWDIRKFSLVSNITSHRVKNDEGVLSLLISKELQVVITSGADGQIKLYKY